MFNARVKIYLTVESSDGTIILRDREIQLIDDGYGGETIYIFDSDLVWRM